jgi:hypothetical protein
MVNGITELTNFDGHNRHTDGTVSADRRDHLLSTGFPLESDTGTDTVTVVNKTHYPIFRCIQEISPITKRFSIP